MKLPSWPRLLSAVKRKTCWKLRSILFTCRSVCSLVGLAGWLTVTFCGRKLKPVRQRLRNMLATIRNSAMRLRVYFAEVTSLSWWLVKLGLCWLLLRTTVLLFGRSGVRFVPVGVVARLLQWSVRTAQAWQDSPQRRNLFNQK